jgi:hypothetical protein
MPVTMRASRTATALFDESWVLAYKEKASLTGPSSDPRPNERPCANGERTTAAGTTEQPAESVQGLRLFII